MVDILVVDDSAFQRHKLTECLTPAASVVGTASTGREGVDAVRRHDPDVVMMDIIMPGIDGIDAVARIREAGISIPVIMCTTVSQTEKMKRAIVAGADGYVEKPYDSEDVTRTVESVLDDEIPTG